MSDNELPPLPNKEKLHTVLPDDYRYGHIYGYTADQMREYARVVKHAAYERAAQVREAPAKVEAERDELRDVLLRNGFVPCDSPACNCGSWHHRYGLPERMQEIKDELAEAGHPLSNENGNMPLNALRELIAERDTLAKDAERMRAALNTIARTPAMPFPDPGAHSARAYHEAVFVAWSRSNQTARAALAQIEQEKANGSR